MSAGQRGIADLFVPLRDRQLRGQDRGANFVGSWGPRSSRVGASPGTQRLLAAFLLGQLSGSPDPYPNTGSGKSPRWNMSAFCSGKWTGGPSRDCLLAELAMANAGALNCCTCTMIQRLPARVPALRECGPSRHTVPVCRCKKITNLESHLPEFISKSISSAAARLFNCVRTT